MRWLIQRGVLPIPRAKNASQATQNAEGAHLRAG
jgi:diketogulonate reductase-like aldo/keto reductase